MASDFYRFRGQVGPHRVEIEFMDTDQPDADRIADVRIEGYDDEEYEEYGGVDFVLKDEIRELIRKGQFTLEYQGGWCPSGTVWGPDGVRYD